MSDVYVSLKDQSESVGVCILVEGSRAMFSLKFSFPVAIDGCWPFIFCLWVLPTAHTVLILRHHLNKVWTEWNKLVCCSVSVSVKEEELVSLRGPKVS